MSPSQSWQISKSPVWIGLRSKGKHASNSLPKLPKEIGGETDIMIGIKYMKYFPKEAYRLPSGLAIHESLFINFDGSKGVVAGPHPVFSEVAKNMQSHVNQPLFSYQVMEYRREYNLGLSVPLLGYNEVFVDTKFDFDSVTPKLFDSKTNTNCYASKRAPKSTKNSKKLKLQERRSPIGAWTVETVPSVRKVIDLSP